MTKETLRDHTTRGQINWRAMKRIHKRNARHSGTFGNVANARRILREIAREAVNSSAKGRAHVRNVANWF